MKISVLQVDRCKPILSLDASDDAFLRQHDLSLTDPGLARGHRLPWVR